MRVVQLFVFALFTAVLFTGFLKEGALAEDMYSLKGKIVSLSDSGFLVKTKVPGLTGPMDKNIRFKVNDKSTMEICWGEKCDSGGAKEGLASLKDLELYKAEGLSPIGKEITVKKGKKGQVFHVKIYYPTEPIHFNAFDFVSPF